MKVRAAAIQINSTADKDRNLEVANRYAQQAVKDGAQLLVLPEKWSVLGSDQQIVAGAESADGPALGWAKSFAKQHGVELVAGSIAEKVAGEELPYNTSFHISASGEVLSFYRKLHMFDVEVEGASYCESDSQSAGNKIVVSESRFGFKLGLSVCYDLRFPELFRVQRLEGAELLTLPAAFTLATTRAHWHTLLTARAIEEQCFVIAANQTGAYKPDYLSGGRSMIIDPWGEVLAVAEEEGECFIAADIDRQRLTEVRAKLPVLKQRREDVYRLDWGSSG